MPFFADAINQMATNHLERLMGESSKIVPFFALNWRRGCLFAHSHRFCASRRRTFVLPQVGQTTPRGQRDATSASSQTFGSLKWVTASMSVCGVSVAIRKY